MSEQAGRQMDQQTADRIAHSLEQVSLILFAMLTPEQRELVHKMHAMRDEMAADHQATREMEQEFGPGPPPWQSPGSSG